MGENQRLDKWLWFARVARTRTRAAELVASGHVRVNARRVDSPAKAVTEGDIVTIALERDVRVLRIVDTGRRRCGFPEAQRLFVDLSEDPGRRLKSP